MHKNKKPNDENKDQDNKGIKQDKRSKKTVKAETPSCL